LLPCFNIFFKRVKSIEANSESDEALKVNYGNILKQQRDEAFNDGKEI
jgi:hypothetical protein